MTRRECGTCRFFEQSGIGESGYCRNARCQEIVGLALVRRQELACRIGWDQDYYEPAASDAIPGQDRPLPDPLRQRTGYQGTRPDDIIVSIEQVRPLPEVPSMLPPTRSRTSSVGQAHRRALERRQLAQQSGANVPPRRLNGVAEAPDTAASASTNGGSARNRITGDEGVSAPRRAESLQPERPSPPANPAPHAMPTESIPVAWEPGVAARPQEERRPPWSSPPGMQVPAAPQQSPSRPPVQQRPPVQEPAGYRGDRAPSYPVPPPPGGTPQNALEAEWYAAERQRHRGKRCANCRDYQMAESGDRGWCRNHFAFPTPQLVGPNDLACLSCIGTWWAAHDQWWLAKVPQPKENMSTPLADDLLEELHEREKRQSVLRRPGTG